MQAAAIRSRRVIAACAVALLALPGQASEPDKETDMTRITFIVGDEELAARLDDTPAARDFASMLPLTITLSDFHGIEKVGDLGRKLDSSGMPGSYEPKAGDITQYAPWKNLAIFVAPFSDSRGLVRLGEFEGDFSALKQAGEIAVRIEAVD